MDSAGGGRLRIVQPEGWPAPRGYSHGIRVPPGAELVFVAGQIGWDADGRFVGPGFVEQFEQALRNCVDVVVAAGGGPDDIVRLTVFCRDRRAYLASLGALGVAYRGVMGTHYPAMSLVEVSALVEEGALVEIEATAALRGSARREER